MPYRHLIASFLIVLILLFAAAIYTSHDRTPGEPANLAGVTVATTAASDTLTTFRTNVNTSLTNLANYANNFSTTTANTFTALQTFSNASSTLLSGTTAWFTTFIGSLTGNASTATALQTGRTINGVTFDGTANITITAASSTLLANNNTFSGNNTFSSTITGSVSGNAGTATALAANGANCTAGNYPLGVDASGAAETCTPLPTSVWNWTIVSHYGVTTNATSTPTHYTNGVFASSTSRLVNASTSILTAPVSYITRLANLTGNGFIKTSGADGTLSIDTTTYESGLTAGDALTRTGNDFDFDGGATPSGDVGGTWASITVTDDSHAHTSATISGIDISADTNLTAGDGLTLTDDDIDCDTASGSVLGCLSAADWTTFNSKNGYGWPWTRTTHYGVTVNSTSTPTHFTAGFMASSTSYFVTASSTTANANTANIGTLAAGTLSLVTSLTVPNGGTGVGTLTGVAIGNGTSAFTAGSTQTCTNQFVRAMSASYVATCASISNADWSGTDLSVANGGTGLSTFGGTNHILYTTAADTLSSEAAFTYNPASDLLTAVNASTTLLSITNALHVGGAATSTIQGSTSGTSTIQGFLTVTGTNSTSTFSGAVDATFLNITGTSATSTFARGINLAGGCFAVAGICIGNVSAGSASSTLLSDTNTWSALNLFARASSTRLSIFDTLYIGGGATSTIQGESTGTSTIQGFLTVSGTNSTSTFSGALTASFLNLTGTAATSTLAGGINFSRFHMTATSTGTFGVNLTGGCFAINGTCLAAVGGSASTTLLVNNNWWTGTNRFTNASTSRLTATSSVWFTGLANRVLAVDSAGLVAGTSTPTANRFHATSTAVASVFPYASSTSWGVTGTAFFANSSSLSSTAWAFGTSTPWGALSIVSTTNPGFVVATSTGAQPTFMVNSSGGIILSASQPATSTTITLDWSATPRQVEYRIGTAATSIKLINATTSLQWGSTKIVYVCNAAGTAGALTWGGVRWIGTAPTQTTTADVCDVYSFNVTRATSSSAFIVAGTAGTGLR